jgi:hypothetical protein
MRWRSGIRPVIIGGVILLALFVAWPGLDGISTVSASNPSVSIVEAVIYFPFVQNPITPELARLVVTEEGYTIGYPSYEWVYGYVENLDPNQNYSITVGVEVTFYPYCDPGDPGSCEPPSTYITELATAFPVSLPGQINPFWYRVMSAKSSYSLGQVFLLSVLPANPNNYPLQIMNWEQNESAISGVARNDTVYTLYDARVVLGTDSCHWREATLDATILHPGQETQFSGLSYCEDEALYLIGQGTASSEIQK